PSRNHPAAIFMPGGYTPARAAPVATRRAKPATGPRENDTPRVAAAAARLAPAASHRADQRSLSVNIALTSAPATKPSCTDIVSHEAPPGPNRHALESAGPTADALNHGAMAHSCATASMARTRRAVRGPWDDRGTPRAVRTCRRDARPTPSHRRFPWRSGRRSTRSGAVLQPRSTNGDRPP